MPTAAMMMHSSSGAAGGGFVTITTDHTKAGSSDTTKFAMLFSTTKAAFKSVANGGQVGNINDFRFATDNAAVSLLTWWIVKWDATTGQLVAIVGLGTLSHTVDNVIYLVFDASSRGSFLGDQHNIWDTNEKIAISGGDGSTLDLNDLTFNADNGTNHAAATATAGPNGLGAISFVSASSQYITCTNNDNFGTPTLQAWVNIAAFPGSRGSIVGMVQGNGSATADKDLQIGTDGKVVWYIFAAGAGQVLTAPAALTTGVWHHVVGTHDGTTQRLYIDGSQVASQAVAGASFTGYLGSNVQINGSYQPASTPSTYLTAAISMMRLAQVARSADQILATYNSFNSPSTFYTVT